VTSFFGIKSAFSRKRQDGSVPNFFQDLGKNTYSLQPVLKSNAPGL